MKPQFLFPKSKFVRGHCRPTILLATLALAAFAVGTHAQPVKIIHEYQLPPTSYVDLGYTQEQVDDAAANGLAFTDRPGLASGLERLAGNHFLSVSDRGPNFTVTAGRVFPLPVYTPTIHLLKIVGDSIQIKWALPITANDAGDPVTGIPNSATEDSVPLADASGTPLPYNPNGMDVEDIHTLPGGGYIVVEEYSPSVVIVNANGKVVTRYTPHGKTLAGASYQVSDTFPAILSQRRANRGFEGVAVSPDGTTAWTATQSPLGPTGANAPTRDSRIVRLIRMDITDPLDVQVTGQFLVKMSPVATYPAGNTQRALKFSAITWVTENKFLFLERSDELLSGVNIGGAKLLLVDIASATNIHGTAVADTLTPEAVNTDLAALGITPATSTVVFSNEQTPEITDFKLEGLAILNSNKVAISNDNDFGIGDFPGAISKVWVIRLEDHLPIAPAE
ncbi:MAG TPA: esterase-like activity of phytase family protein [Chthoniobacteraceae bacterium]|nr:esterase-like activity of phytase family protein [Chthoniobacteraceae bacterium]